MSVSSYCVGDVVTATPGQALAEAASAMRKQGVGCLVVTDRDRPIGMLTDRDVALTLLAGDGPASRHRVRDAMQVPVVSIERSSSLREAIATMGRRGLRRLPVVDEDGRLTGLLCADDVIGLIAEELFAIRGAIGAQLPEMKAAKVPTRSAQEHFHKRVVTVGETATPTQVARELARQHVGCAVVRDVDGRAVGMITDRDLATRALPLGAEPALAGELMTKPLISVTPDVPLEHVVKLMREKGIRRIPVMRDDELVGLVSLDDVLLALGEELTQLGSAVRQAIARSEREQKLRQLRSAVEETLDWSIHRAEALGEQAQEKLSGELEAIREQLRGSLG